MPSAAKAASQWATYRFDQVAELVNERVDDPSQAGVDRYVGLEHLDAGSLRISRWGVPSDVTATKLRFRPGDIIFGRRRVYQRKVAVANFEGICSAHAMVLRSRPGTVLPEFLPYFMQTDLFMERALEISVGSLSPTINWKALAKEEFALPPVDEQRRIAADVHACDLAQDRIAYLAMTIDKVATSLAERMFASTREMAQVGDVVHGVRYGTSVRCSVDPVGVPVLRIPNVVHGGVDSSDLKWSELSDAEREKYSVVPGDILMVRTNGNPAYVGRSVVVEEVPSGSVFASYLLRLRVNREVILPAVLGAIFKAPQFQRRLKSVIRSSAGNYNLNAKNLQQQQVAVPPRDVQIKLARDLSALRAARGQAEARLASMKSVRKQMLQVLEK